MEAKAVEKKITLEKRLLIAKRNLLKEVVPCMDTVLALRDKVREIADDADLNFSYCWEWTLNNTKN